MMIGGVAYLYPLSIKRSSKKYLEWLALVLIFCSYFMISKENPWPGYLAIFPVLGAFLLIQAQHSKSLITGNIVLQLLGKWSYSIYLWHWPLVVVIYYLSLSEYYIFAGIVLSVLLGFLSNKYIERLKFRNNFKSLLSYLNCKPVHTVLFVSVLGSIIYQYDGMEFRSENPNYSLTVERERLKPNFGLSKHCQENITLKTECQTSAAPNIVIWGDSFAMHLIPGIIESNPDVDIVQFTRSECAPFIDSAVVRNGNDQKTIDCLAFNESVKALLEKVKNIKYVVMSSPFEQYDDFDNEILKSDGSVETLNISNLETVFRNTLRFIEGLGMVPVVFSPPPTTGKNIGQCLTKSAFHHDDLDKCNFNFKNILPRQAQVYNFLNNLKADYNVVSIEDVLCKKDGICKANVNGQYLYRDSGHLSIEGSRYLGATMNFYQLIISPVSAL